MEYDDVVKRDYSTATRRRMADEGTAMPDGSYPIANRSDLANAIHMVGLSTNAAAARRHIMRRARALGLSDMIPESWKMDKFWGGIISQNIDWKV